MFASGPPHDLFIADDAVTRERGLFRRRRLSRRSVVIAASCKTGFCLLQICCVDRHGLTKQSGTTIPDDKHDDKYSHVTACLDSAHEAAGIEASLAVVCFLLCARFLLLCALVPFLCARFI